MVRILKLFFFFLWDELEVERFCRLVLGSKNGVTTNIQDSWHKSVAMPKTNLWLGNQNSILTSRQSFNLQESNSGPGPFGGTIHASLKKAKKEENGNEWLAEATLP